MVRAGFTGVLPGSRLLGVCITRSSGECRRSAERLAASQRGSRGGGDDDNNYDDDDDDYDMIDGGERNNEPVSLDLIDHRYR